MQLTQKQKEIARDNHRFRVVNAGRRFGKTILAVEEMIGVAIAEDDRRVCYIAPTFQQARDIAWEHLKARCQPIAIETNESQLKITLRTQRKGKSTIVLKSWDAIESLRGQKFHFIVLDEVAMMRAFWVGWQEVLRPTLTDTKGASMFISTPKGFNHFYDLYNLEREDDNFKSFHATSFDNPFIDPKEIEEARKQLTEDRFHQEYMADFRKMEGLVYKEFTRDTHLFDDKTTRSEVIEVICGIDFGYTNPTAIYKIERDKDNHYWVTWEWYKAEKTTAEIVEMAASVNANIYYPDPAEPDRIAEMDSAGLYVHEVSKDVTAGIESVRELLKQKRLHVHKDCQNLINEFETYRYAEPKPDKNLVEVPVKDNDHGLDAIRYALHMNKHVAPYFDDDEETLSLYTYDVV